MGRLVMARALAQRRAPPGPRAPDALVGVLGSSTARFASRQLWSADGGFQGTLLSLVTQAAGVRAVGRGSGRRARLLPRLRKKSCQRTVSGPPQSGSERVSERFEGAQVARTVCSVSVPAGPCSGGFHSALSPGNPIVKHCFPKEPYPLEGYVGLNTPGLVAPNA